MAYLEEIFSAENIGEVERLVSFGVVDPDRMNI